MINKRMTEEKDILGSKFWYTHNLFHQLATMLTLTRLLNSNQQLCHQLKLILEESIKILQVEKVILYLFNEQKNEIWSHFVSDGELKRIHYPFVDGVISDTIKNGQVLIVDANNRNVGLKDKIIKNGFPNLQSCIIVPIVNKNREVKGCLQIINKNNDKFEQQDSLYVKIMADLLSLAIQDTMMSLESQEGKRLEKELGRAIEIQKQLMPEKVPQVPGYDIFAFNQPSKYVSGDYYDFFPFPRSMSFVVADVSGKGVPASLMTANLHAFLHAGAIEIDSCSEVVRKINNHMFLYSATDMFATLFWGNLNHYSHKYKYVNAGHLPPVLIKKDSSVKKLKSHGVPIGIVDSFGYNESEMKIDPGDTLIVASDGITEAENHECQMFGTKRLIEIAKHNSNLPCNEIGKLILEQVKGFARPGNLSDDMTLMIIKRNTN